MQILPRHLVSPGKRMAENRNSNTEIQTACDTENAVIPLSKAWILKVYDIFLSMF